LDIIFSVDPRVASYATADGAGLPMISRGRFEEPVRSWSGANKSTPARTVCGSWNFSKGAESRSMGNGYPVGFNGCE